MLNFLYNQNMTQQLQVLNTLKAQGHSSLMRRRAYCRQRDARTELRVRQILLSLVRLKIELNSILSILRIITRLCKCHYN